MTNEEATKNLKKLKSFHNGSYGTAIDMAIKALEQQQDVHDTCKKCIEFSEFEQQLRWIPVSERLPKEHICDDGYIEPSEYVLICDDLNYCHVSRYWGNRRNKRDYKDWVDADLSTRKIIAWMPLPEPYKAESEESE